MRRYAWIIAATVIGLALTAAVAAVEAWRKPRPPRAVLEVVGDPAESGRPEAPDGAPNVVVVIGCTVRRDQLQLYRPELDTTPWLVETAARGAVFDDMVTAAPWTRAANVAILTGKHPASVGMVEPEAGPNKRALADEVETMAEWFRDHGWQTLGGTANPNTNSDWNLHQGFDRYVQPSELWAMGGQAKFTGWKVISRLLPLIDQRQADTPTYLQLLLVDAHAPYPRPPAGSGFDKSVPRRVHAYREGLRGLDKTLGRLSDALAERGMTEENTIFVFLNDHGEGLNFPEHHGKAHGAYLAPSTVGGVWVMSGPGVPEGVRVGGMASQVDVFPTLAELAGVPLAEVGPGRSHVAALSTGRTEREVAYTDTWFQFTNRAAAYTARYACQEDFRSVGASRQSRRFKSGCFDRQADPSHTRPMAWPPVQEDLIRWRAQLEAEMAAFKGGGDATPSEATRKQLEALGYADPVED